MGGCAVAAIKFIAILTFCKKEYVSIPPSFWLRARTECFCDIGNTLIKASKKLLKIYSTFLFSEELPESF